MRKLIGSLFLKKKKPLIAMQMTRYPENIELIGKVILVITQLINMFQKVCVYEGVTSRIPKCV